MCNPSKIRRGKKLHTEEDFIAFYGVGNGKNSIFEEFFPLFNDKSSVFSTFCVNDFLLLFFLEHRQQTSHGSNNNEL
jgi:hypothetical protein